MSPVEWGKEYLHVMLAEQNPKDDQIVMNFAGGTAKLIDPNHHETKETEKEVIPKERFLPNPNPNRNGIQGIEIICGVFFAILVIIAIVYYICEKNRQKRNAKKYKEFFEESDTKEVLD